MVKSLLKQGFRSNGLTGKTYSSPLVKGLVVYDGFFGHDRTRHNKNRVARGEPIVLATDEEHRHTTWYIRRSLKGVPPHRSGCLTTREYMEHAIRLLGVDVGRLDDRVSRYLTEEATCQ